MTGLLRRWAGEQPEAAEGRWLALRVAEHLEPVERRAGEMLGRPLRERGLDPLAERVERNPLAALLGAAAAGWLVGKLLD